MGYMSHIEDRMRYITLYIILACFLGCAGVTTRTDRIDLSSAIRSETGSGAITVADHRSYKSISVTGLFPATNHLIEPIPGVDRLLVSHQALTQLRIVPGDSIQIYILDIQFMGEDKLFHGNAKLNIAVHVSITKNGKVQDQYLTSEKFDNDIRAGFKGIPYKEICKDYLVITTKDIAEKIATLYLST